MSIARAITATLLLAVLVQPATAPAQAAPAPHTPLTLAAPMAPAAPLSICTTVVTGTANSGYGSLRDAVACAPSGGTVTFSSTVAGSLILLSSEIAFTQTLTIDGSGAPGVRVDGNNSSRIFNIGTSSPVTLTALILQRGHPVGDGGAVLAGASSPLVISQLSVLSSTAAVGGGLYTGSTLILTGTEFISNTSDGGGGGVWATSAVTLTNGRFERNICTQGGCQGGGLYTYDTLTLTGTEFISNTSDWLGGGAYADGAVTTLINGRFQGNTSGAFGGGLITNGTLILTGTEFISNTSGFSGGGALAGGAATLTNGRFQGNTCTLTDCQGGGLWSDALLTLTGTEFISNTSVSHGGGAYTTGAVTLTNGRFQGNTCTGGGCQGGGLYADSRATLNSSSFSGNQAAGWGGGVGVTGTATLTLTNVTLSANSASVSGGGLYAGGSGSATLLNVTVANNAAPSGGGLYANAAATVGVTNTVFVNNGAATCAGQIDAGTHNLEFPGTTCTTAGPTAGFTTADAQLAPLALNAPGLTWTHALLAGSPARDAGHAATCAGPLVNNLDQRGVTRPIDGNAVPGAVCDIGAYEAAASVWFYLYLPLVLR